MHQALDLVPAKRHLQSIINFAKFVTAAVSITLPPQYIGSISISECTAVPYSTLCPDYWVHKVPDKHAVSILLNRPQYLIAVCHAQSAVPELVLAQL